MIASRLAVSNLAWPVEAEDQALDILVAEGAGGIEVAPRRLAPWPELTPTRLRTFRNACAQRGLAIPSLQGIFYDAPGVALLADAAAFAAMAEHMRRVGDIAQTLGAAIAVFGAPGARRRGPMTADAAMDSATGRLLHLADIAAGFGLTIGMEAVPAYYGGDFLLRYSEVRELVARCGHPNIRVHFDIACATLAGCDPAEVIHACRPIHYHIAEPDLVPLRFPSCDHGGASAALEQTGYSDWLVIEMRDTGVSDLSAINESLSFTRRVYGDRILNHAA